MDVRGASAEALDTLTEQLDGAIGTNKSAASLGEELFTVSRLMRTEAALRRFATDGSLPVEAKQGMVQQVFKGSVGDGALDPLNKAVSRRWTISRDPAREAAVRSIPSWSITGVLLECRDSCCEYAAD